MIIKLDQVYCKKGVIMKLYLIIILLGSKLFGQCDANYFDMGYISYFWSSTQIHENATWIRTMFHNSAHVGNLSYSNNYGFSCRCVMD
ncbi:uncharacterized protein METZ01_LOCUS353193 [marine metagenome]|uniref:Fibrobacter succinogenes major paralogous domain-containing protein n=1 Tax=marine metagenome TaxID=408172 RepID=A0A382RRN1_9ZZZZ